MPVYLLHGFRWPRQLVRIHIIIHNLDDAAAEWLIAPATTKTLLHNFHELHPPLMAHLPNLRFVEQYDPSDETVTSQPYAYVADMVHEIHLGVDVDEVRGRGVKNEQWAALVELRDKLCPGEKVAWYVVICGDEERWAPSLTPTPSSTTFHSQPSTYQGTHQSNGSRVWSTRQRSGSQSTYGHNSQESRPDTRQGRFSRQSRESGEELGGKKKRSSSLSRGLAKVFGRNGELNKSRSVKDLRDTDAPSSAYTTQALPPPLPGTAR